MRKTKWFAALFAAVGLALCLAGCEADTEYVDRIVEKTYAAPVTFTSKDAGKDGVEVTMASATEGAKIYYTTDGSEPKVGGESTSEYTAPVTLTEDTTIKAVAVKEGIENSPMSSAFVSITEKTIIVTKEYALPVTFTTGADESGITVTVEMACATEGAEIYYTTDGSEPTAKSTRYTKPVTLKEDTTVKAVAVKDGMENSPVSLVSVSITLKEVTVQSGYYTVKHLVKSLDDDSYELFNTTSEYVSEEKPAAELALSNKGISVAAMSVDSKTVTLFYTRNVITYTFNAGEHGAFSGGSTSVTRSGLYGASFSAPSAPSETDDDYGFTGWKDDGGNALVMTFGPADKTYTAQWAKKTKYTFNAGTAGGAQAEFSDGRISSVVKGLPGESVDLPKPKKMDGYWLSAWKDADGNPKPSVFGDTDMIFTAEWKENDDVPEGFVSVTMENTSKLLVQETEMTQKMYTEVMGENPSRFSSNPADGETQELRPVEYVSWYDAIYFCNKKSVADGLTPVYAVNGETDVTQWSYTPHKGNSISGTVTQNESADGWRLPTKDEWQYAAKGGEEYTYAGSDSIDDVAWYGDNSGYKTHEVKKKNANAYGLYDMSGNVWEWCWDTHVSYRCRCGGSWHYSADGCEVSSWRHSNAYYRGDSIGFRLVRSL